MKQTIQDIGSSGRKGLITIDRTSVATWPENMPVPLVTISHQKDLQASWRFLNLETKDQRLKPSNFMPEPEDAALTNPKKEKQWQLRPSKLREVASSARAHLSKRHGTGHFPPAAR
jgi:hypothetical protein